MTKFKIAAIVLFVSLLMTKIYANNKSASSEIFKNIRCLVCQGQSIADSNSDFAQTIKLVVLEQIDNGKSETEIYNFLIEKYGEWIVFKPPFNRNNFILWVLPYAAFLLGGIFLFLMLKKRGKT